MTLIEREQQDRESYQIYPSPKGADSYENYIQHRIRMLTPAMQVYGQRKFVKLSLDKYIEENRASDRIALRLTENRPTIAFIGSATMAANSPIGIKRRLRCPGTRRLVRSFKKLGNVIVRFVDEWKTSQTCAKCFWPFDRQTKRDRYKVCPVCIPIFPDTMRWQLPDRIIADRSNRDIERERKQAIQDGGQAGRGPRSQRLVSKINKFFKNWQLNGVTGNWEELILSKLNTVWHRDIVAAKCILYKGMCCVIVLIRLETFSELIKIILISGLCTLLGIPIHPQLQRPTAPNENEPPDVNNNGYEFEEGDNFIYVPVSSDESDAE